MEFLMKTSSRKQKGRRLCQQVKELMLSGLDHLQDDDIIVTTSGDTGEDLKLSPAARTVYPVAIECKNQEKLNIWKALEQAEHHSEKYTPVLFFSRNRSKIYATMEADKLISLYKRTSELEAMLDQLVLQLESMSKS